MHKFSQQIWQLRKHWKASSYLLSYCFNSQETHGCCIATSAVDLGKQLWTIVHYSLEKKGILTLRNLVNEANLIRRGAISNTTTLQQRPLNLTAFEKNSEEKIIKMGKNLLLFYKFSASERVTPELQNVKFINHNHHGFSKVTINLWIHNNKASTNTHTLCSLTMRKAATLSFGNS